MQKFRRVATRSCKNRSKQWQMFFLAPLMTSDRGLEASIEIAIGAHVEFQFNTKYTAMPAQFCLDCGF